MNKLTLVNNLTQESDATITVALKINNNHKEFKQY